MQFYPVRQGNLPRLILCVYAWQRERQSFSVYFCVAFISHLSRINPWDSGRIVPQPMKSDSWENNSIVAPVVYPPCYEKAMAAACSTAHIIMSEITNIVQSIFSPDWTGGHGHQ